MKKSEILRRLEERLARGEISEKTYLEIKARYESEPETPEPGPEREAGPEEIASFATHLASEVMSKVTKGLESIDLSLEDLGTVVKTNGHAVKIAGSGVVTGPIHTEEFKCAGSGRCEGDLTANVVKVAGSCTFEGDVKAREFKVSGSSKIHGGLTTEEGHASGSFHVAKDVEATELHLAGSAKFEGNVKARELVVTGSIDVAGDLEAGELTIELDGPSRVGSIRADEIDVRRPRRFLRGSGGLVAESIEGQEIHLEGTKARFVRGVEVNIGPHCRIDKVVAETLTVHESSEVRERERPS